MNGKNYNSNYSEHWQSQYTHEYTPVEYYATETGADSQVYEQPTTSYNHTRSAMNSEVPNQQQQYSQLTNQSQYNGYYDSSQMDPRYFTDQESCQQYMHQQPTIEFNNNSFMQQPLHNMPQEPHQQLQQQPPPPPPQLSETQEAGATASRMTTQAKAEEESDVKNRTVIQRSVLPAHNFKKSKKKGRTQQQPAEAVDSLERPSSRGTCSSEISRIQNDSMNDQYAKWYQMLNEYMKQYCPDVRIPRPGAQGRHAQAPDYATLCQYYLEAQRQWAGNFVEPGVQQVDDGRRTPHLFNTPHVRVSLQSPGLMVQVLPSRPVDGEPARVELLDLNQVATESIAEAAFRASQLMQKTRDEGEGVISLDEAATSADAGSSRLDASEDEASQSTDAQEAAICADITDAWDRSDNVFFPGPLSRQHTMKADILAYLREKLSDIQDRLPIDWESASLLIAFLEQLVKSNGVIEPADLVQVLLDGQEITTRELRERASGGAVARGQEQAQQPVQMRLTGPPMHSSMCDQFESPSQPVSRQNSPGGSVASSRRSSRRFNASMSDAGPYNMHSLIRKVAQATALTVDPSGDRQLEDKALDRLRQLLMNGLTMKALEHACRSKLWGHAFALAQRLPQPGLVQRVMERFMRTAIPLGDPVLSLYQLWAGELPQVVNSVAYSGGPDSGEWRPHLAMLLAARAEKPDLVLASLERLGDSLMSRQLTFAAHLCYLLMDQVQPQRNRLPGKIWLLGATHPSDDPYEHKAFFLSQSEDLGPVDEHALSDPGSVPSEAIQFTEIYEYTRSLQQPDFILYPFLPYKLAYAIRLLDAGLCENAFRYLHCVTRGLLAFAEMKGGAQGLHGHAHFFRLTGMCVELASRLQFHPEVDRTDDLNWLIQLTQLHDSLSCALGLPSWSLPFVHPQPVPEMQMRNLCLTESPPPVSQAPLQEPPQQLHQQQQVQQQQQYQPPKSEPDPPAPVQQLPPQQSFDRQQQLQPPQPVSQPMPTPVEQQPPPQMQSSRHNSNVFESPIQMDQVPSKQSTPLRSPTQMSQPVAAKLHKQSDKMAQPGFFNPVSFVDYTQPQEAAGQQAFDYFGGFRSGQRSRNTSTSSVATSQQQQRSRMPSTSSTIEPVSPVLSNHQQQQPPASHHPVSRAPNISAPPPTEEKECPMKPQEAAGQPDNNAKNGWFSGWLRKPKQGIHLPDDTNPKLVWDKERKCWVDLANPDASSDIPPPPPAMPNFQPPPVGIPASKPRQRYVDPLAKQAAPPPANVTPFLPPLPGQLPGAGAANGNN